MSHLAMKDELKQCPFCGGKATLGKHVSEFNDANDYDPRVLIIARCRRCLAHIDTESKEETIKLWNTRTPDKEAAFEWFKDGAFEMNIYVLGEDIRAEFERLWTEKHGGSDE